MDLIKLLFVSEYADKIQYLTSVLEIIGLTMAFIELKYPKRKDQLENFIDMSGDKMYFFSNKLTKNNLFNSLVTLLIFLMFFFVVPWYGGFFKLFLNMEELNLLHYTFYLVIGLITIVGVLFSYVSLGNIIRSLDRFSNGHAIGSIGLLLAFIGFLGNIYQMIVEFINK